MLYKVRDSEYGEIWYVLISEREGHIYAIDSEGEKISDHPQQLQHGKLVVDQVIEYMCCDPSSCVLVTSNEKQAQTYWSVLSALSKFKC